jgi:hypothetical protein
MTRRKKGEQIMDQEYENGLSLCPPVYNDAIKILPIIITPTPARLFFCDANHAVLTK